MFKHFKVPPKRRERLSTALFIGLIVALFKATEVGGYVNAIRTFCVTFTLATLAVMALDVATDWIWTKWKARSA
ncbi:hypothetical protein [Marivita hallyeonensis]|uniref:Uncharacterized protein n=1 Tax=Marivita hallyeonensis TaxID=996342 RepID=A0A1M5XR98_9RHOB|nr:hypothetical protein [Marivita hallyeonensis]SHI02279.1 hypothetical protein SAMN05443551_4075 [Marivita hallyeonensis]